MCRGETAYPPTSAESRGDRRAQGGGSRLPLPMDVGDLESVPSARGAGPNGPGAFTDDPGRAAPADPAPGASGRPRSARAASVVPFTLLVGVLVVGALVNATPEGAWLFGVEGPRCPSTWVVDAGCPGCGLTRGTALLLDGDFEVATRVHPGAWLVVALAAAGALVHGLVLVKGEKSAWTDRLLRTGRVVFGVGLLLAWLARLV